MTKNKHQLKERPSLEAIFLKLYRKNRSFLTLGGAEALQRYRRFEVAAYEAPDTAVSVARDDTVDLAMNNGALLEHIHKLIRADNPSRACKIYGVAMADVWTKSADKKMKGIRLGVGIAGCAGFVSLIHWLLG